MTRAEIERQALELTERDRLELAEVLWTSVEAAATLPLRDWQRDLLDERLAAADTEQGRDWEEIKAEIWPRAK